MPKIEINVKTVTIGSRRFKLAPLTGLQFMSACANFLGPAPNRDAGILELIEQSLANASKGGKSPFPAETLKTLSPADVGRLLVPIFQLSGARDVSRLSQLAAIARRGFPTRPLPAVRQ